MLHPWDLVEAVIVGDVAHRLEQPVTIDEGRSGAVGTGRMSFLGKVRHASSQLTECCRRILRGSE
jgi:hypothetical protein